MPAVQVGKTGIRAVINPALLAVYQFLFWLDTQTAADDSGGYIGSSCQQCSPGNAGRITQTSRNGKQQCIRRNKQH